MVETHNSVSPAAPVKRALLIGINEYKYTQSSDMRPLHGCLNDIEDMASILTRKFGFKQGDIVTLA